MKARKMPNRQSKRLFKATASKVHKKNSLGMKPGLRRGGIRL